MKPNNARYIRLVSYSLLLLILSLSEFFLFFALHHPNNSQTNWVTLRDTNDKKHTYTKHKRLLMQQTDACCSNAHFLQQNKKAKANDWRFT